MAELPKTPIELTQLPKLPDLSVDKLPIDVQQIQGLADRLQPLMSSFVGELLLGTIAFWLVVLGAIALALEAIVVGYRMWKGETFLSALLLWGSHRKKRTKSFTKESDGVTQVPKATEAVVEIIPKSQEPPSPLLPTPPHSSSEIEASPLPPPPEPAIVSSPMISEPANTSVPEPVLALAEVAPALMREPVAHSLVADPIPSGEDILSDMYAMKIGVLKVLRVQRALEDELGNTSGIQAMDVLIAAVEGADPQKIWDMGSRKIKDNT